MTVITFDLRYNEGTEQVHPATAINGPGCLTGSPKEAADMSYHTHPVKSVAPSAAH